MSTLQPTRDAIRNVLREHAGLRTDPGELAPDADLAQAGMTPTARLNVLLALEGEFEVEFPARLIRRDALRSIASIERALQELIAA